MTTAVVLAGCATQKSKNVRTGGISPSITVQADADGVTVSVRRGAGGVNTVEIIRNGQAYVPEHLSKDQDIRIAAGDVISVSTPGGGGFGPPSARDAEAVKHDVALGYYTAEESRRLFEVAAPAV